MIKFIICDDNSQALEKASQIITKVMMKYDSEYRVYKFSKYDEKLKSKIREKFDIKVYILDIELPKISGLEIASEIREEDDESTIIFVTAHPECKNDIFYSRLQAIDFISKFYCYERRLEETIEHVVKKIYRNKWLEFTYNHVYEKVMYKEISYIEKSTSQNKCIIHLMDGTEKYINGSITGLKEELGLSFYRTHKSCLINLTNIKKIDYPKLTIYFLNGDYTDLMTVGSRKELKQLVGNC